MKLKFTLVFILLVSSAFGASEEQVEAAKKRAGKEDEYLESHKSCANYPIFTAIAKNDLDGLAKQLLKFSAPEGGLKFSRCF